MVKKLVIAVVIVALVAIGLYLSLRSGTNGIQYKTAPLTSGSIRSTVTATGTVNPVVTVNVGTQVSGTIKFIHADYNSVVKKGQIIAEIDPAILSAQVDQARANLLAAKANVLKARATLADSKRTMERNRQLIAKHLISQSDFDTSETTWQSNEAQLKANEAQVAQAQAALNSAETNLAYTKIISPVNGIVVSRNVDVGQTVAASFQTPTLFNIAQDLTKMQIDTSVDEADIGKVQVGQNVDFNVDAYPDILFRGKVAQVRINPTTVSNVVTYDVVIQVDNKELKLKPGMTANVSIVTAVKEGVLKAPNSALRFKPANSEEKTAKGAKRGQALWILVENKPKRVKVAAGISDGSFTEISSDGLKEGQEVITEALNKSKKADVGAPSPFGPPRPPR